MSQADLPAAPAQPDPWAELRQHTPARIALGRAGGSLPTAEVLRFAAAHAMARDAVHVALDVTALSETLCAHGFAPFVVQSRAPTREAYLRRPDWGRRLDEASVNQLQSAGGFEPDLAVVIGDGLSATATQQHALPLMLALRSALAGTLTWAPVVIATQTRVALADEVGALLHARAVLILLGERPGLSSPDSLGAYLTYAPKVGCTDAQRNCVSNIRPEGLGYEAAARRIGWLLREALRRQLTGVGLKDDSETVLLGSESSPG